MIVTIEVRIGRAMRGMMRSVSHDSAGSTAVPPSAGLVRIRPAHLQYSREMSDALNRHHVFRKLHESGCFVIPNPYDLGSARVLAQLGFTGLATTSSSFAWTLGRQDNHITLDDALAHYRLIASGVDVPVNADFEGGFAIEPERVAVNVKAVTATGVAGLSIEDSTGDRAQPLFDFPLAVDRIR